MAQYPAEIDLSTLDGSNGFAITGVPAGAYLGWSVASAGDINRDGYADLIIGAPRDGASSGTAYVLLGSAAGFAAAVDVTALNGTDGFAIRGIPGSGEATGESVSSAGDINGDGFADLIIGAPYAIDATLNANPGAAYVVFGHGGTFSDVDVSSLDGSNGFRILGAASGDRTGYSVSSVGDINGDGFGDVVVGAEDADPNGTASGAAYVVFGRAGGFGATVDVSTLDGSNGFKISGAAATDQFGHSVSSAGDVNGDGFADIVIGAFGSAANGTLYGGASYVVFGKATGFAANIDLSTLDGTNGFLIDASGAGAQHVGWSVAGAGDVNGDGFADLLISARNANGDAPVSGVSYVVFGKASGFGATVDLGALDGSNGFAITGAHSFDYASWSVKSAGDVNGDGFDDVIIGALDADPNGHDAAGAAYVVFGKPGGFGASVDLAALDGTDGFEIGGFVPNGYAGASVSAAGDLNGDGLSDLIVGAYHASSGGSTYAGQSYVVYGILPDGPVTRTGTDASQTLVGGHFDDTLNGLGGDDLLYSNGGNDTLNGGDGNDGFALKGTYTAADHIDGGDGSNDQIALDGDYSGGVTLTAASIINVEVMALQPGFNYMATTADDFVAAGQTFTFWSVTMGAGNSAGIDGSAETDGQFNFFMGQGIDTVAGGAGNDLIYGEGGGDFLLGGGGSDTFAYLAPSDSTGPAFDRLGDFQAGTDKFELPSGDTVAAIDPELFGGALSAASFDTDLAAAVDATKLAAHHAVLFTPNAGGDAGSTFLVVDANGVAGYQAGQDFVFEVDHATIAGLAITDFI